MTAKAKTKLKPKAKVKAKAKPKTMAKGKKSKKNLMRVSPSKLALLLKCSGSLAYSKEIDITTPKNPDALLGDVAHKISEEVLNPHTHSPRKERIELSLDERICLEVNKDKIMEYVDFYCRKILMDKEVLEETYGVECLLYVERKFSFQNSVLEMNGLTDAVLSIYDKANDVRIVKFYDLKTGMVEVDAVGNKQLQAYAQLWAHEMPGFVKNCELEGIIIQPSLKTYGSTPIVIIDDFFDHVSKIIKKIQTKGEILKAGYHCRYCPVNDVCSVFKTTIEKYMNPEHHDDTVDRSTQWSELLDMLGPMVKLHEKIKKEAKVAMEFGQIVPNYELADKSAKRSWVSDVPLNSIARKLGLKAKDMEKVSKTSPAQIEKKMKACGATEKNWENFNESIYSATIRYIKRTD